MVLRVSGPSLGEAELAAVGRVMRSGYLGMGNETRRFEEELGRFLGGANRHVVCTSSGTSALHLALEALGLGAGDEVLVPSLTFVATFQAVRACGARPEACDVRLEDGLLDVEDARRRITPRTRAVLPVHFGGYPGKLEAVYDFARAYGLRVVEDAAHAFGTLHRGAPIGSIGDVACFSFDPIKNITSGEGGAVTTADASVAARVRQMRQLGIRPRARADKPESAPVPPEVDLPGWRYHMPDLAAAIGRVQLSRFPGELRPRRVELARRYRERLREVRHVALLDSSDEVVPHLFPIRLLGVDRDALQRRLAEKGYETAVHYKPNHLHPLFGSEGARPVAERLYRELLSLPLHGQVGDQDVDQIVDLVRASAA